MAQIESSAHEESPRVPARTVADVVGETLADQGVHNIFGLLGSGNLVVTEALVARGAMLHHSRLEAGAVTAADGYARVSGHVGVVSVHQGPGLTNTLTGLTEAAKSRTPLLVLAGETPAAALTSNFRIDQHGLVESVGAIAERVHSPQTAADDALRAYERARSERRPVVLMLPIDIQARPPGQAAPTRPAAPVLEAPAPASDAVARAAELLNSARQPLVLAGRGAVLAQAGPDLEALAARTGAVLATSAPAKGLFHDPYALGISGGFASPHAQELIRQADVVLIAGASANHWTTRHGKLLAREAKVIQIDTEARAIARHRPADVALIADAGHAARALIEATHEKTAWRTLDLAGEIDGRRWVHEPYEDAGSDEFIDPRTLSIALNDVLPFDRAVVVDSGHFMGYPSMYLDVPNAESWVFMNGYQAVGLAIGAGIGASIAQPGRPTVVAVGDGGAYMALQELETAARLKLELLIVIYDDSAYGAEVHHFGPMGYDVTRVRFPDSDLAGIAHAAGCKAATIRHTDELAVVAEWVANPHGPLVLDCKVNPTICAEWLAEAFRGG